MEKEKISVLVPVYNSEKYIGKCIESVLNQTYKNIELIIVNDGSKDKSYEIIEEYKNKDNRIKAISTENRGVSFARNTALDNATGNFLSFVDSDDYIDEDYLETLYNVLKKENADISMCNCKLVEENNKTYIKTFGISNMQIMNGEEAVENLFYYNYMRHSPWGKLYKKEIFEGYRYKTEGQYEDLELTYKLFLKAKKLVYVPECKYNYLLRTGSIVHSKIKKSNIEAILTYTEQILEDIKTNHKNIEKSAEFLVADHSLDLWYKIPNKKEYKGYIKRATKNIKKYRKGILKNKKVNKKSKILFYLSYLGRNIYKILNTIRKKIQKG